MLILGQIILAVYYTLADIVLVAQCYWYRGWGAKHTSGHSAVDGTGTESDTSKPPSEHDIVSERSPLLSGNRSPVHVHDLGGWDHRTSFSSQVERNRLFSTIQEHVPNHDASHLSPTVPLHAPPNHLSTRFADEECQAEEGQPREHRIQSHSTAKAVLFNAAAVLVVCAAGVLGWWLSWRGQSESSREPEAADDELYFNIQGQIYGYICAVLYLASRVPQLWQNYQRKKTDGLSFLFFLFACIGNLTYVLSIVAYDPTRLCHHHQCRKGEDVAIYGKYILVNLSWLIGSFGTLLLDLGVFVQFFIYRGNNDDYLEHEDASVRHETQSDYTDDTVVADVYRIQRQRPRRQEHERDPQEEIH